MVNRPFHAGFRDRVRVSHRHRGRRSRPPPSETGPDVALGEKHSCAIINAILLLLGWQRVRAAGCRRNGAEQPSACRLGRRILPWSRRRYRLQLARDDRGQVWCWGLNDRGQLGTGDRESRDVPTLVALPRARASSALIISHTCALLVDSTLHCWGKNDEGELGQNDELTGGELSADALVPTAVPGEFRTVETGQATHALSSSTVRSVAGAETARTSSAMSRAADPACRPGLAPDNDWSPVEARTVITTWPARGSSAPTAGVSTPPLATSKVRRSASRMQLT